MSRVVGVTASKTKSREERDDVSLSLMSYKNFKLFFKKKRNKIATRMIMSSCAAEMNRAVPSRRLRSGEN